jgi:hypothetical protein
MQSIVERYANKIRGVISCYDRVVITGTIPGACYARGMTQILFEHNIRIFDYTKYVEPLRDEIRINADKLAEKNGLKIEFIRKNNFRKEARIKEVLNERGHDPGLVHIFSAMEPCNSYKPWHDKSSHKTYLRSTSGKCLHYYFYLIDENLGLCYIRVPTWCPFRLQIYFNGHNLLANQLKKSGIDFKMLENAFVDINDFDKAQEISDGINVAQIHKTLDDFALQFCPVIKKFPYTYHWSIMQAEYATDIVFKRQKDLQPLYENISRTAIHAVKAENIATFLGRKLHGNYQDEMGNDFSTRIQGTRIKHSMGKVSIKMYDKFSLVLRIETTVNDVSFFKHYRTVEHRDGTSEKKNVSMKKGIYSLAPLREILLRANIRYLEFISAMDDNSAEVKNLNKISKTVVKDNRPYKGINLFSEEDQDVFEALTNGGFNIRGFQNKNLCQALENKTSSQISRIIKKLRIHGIIRKIPRSYRYHLSKLGKAVVILGLKLKEMVVIPGLKIKEMV